MAVRILCLLWALGLFACGNDKPAKVVETETIQKYEREVVLQGSVSTNGSAVKSGLVEARLVSGQLLASMELDNSPRFKITIPAGTVLPVVLSYATSANTPEADKLLSVVVQTGVYRYDINPLTHAIASQARSMGGYSFKNMTQAAADSVHVPDANKTTTGFRGDPTTQYGGWH